jgi:hypothetical protein
MEARERLRLESSPIDFYKKKDERPEILANTNRFDLLNAENIEIDHTFLLKMLENDDEIDAKLDGTLFK